MTKNKKMLLLLGVLAALIALYVVVTSLGSQTSSDSNLSELDTQQSTQTYTFFTLRAEELTAFSFTNQGEKYAFTLSEDKTRWHWDSEPTLPINNSYVTLMINAVLELSSSYKYEGITSDALDGYGLGADAIKLTFTLANGTQTGLLFGKTNSFNYLTYCALTTDPTTVYMISAGIPPYFATTPANMVENDKLPTFTEAQFYGFQLTLGEESYLYDYDYPDGETTAETEKQMTLYHNSQVVDEVDDETCDTLVELVMSWVLDDAATFDPDQYATYGVTDESANQLTLHYTYTKTYEDATTGTTNSTEFQAVCTLLLGNATEDGKTYVRMSDKTGVYALDLSAILALAN